MRDKSDFRAARARVIDFRARARVGGMYFKPIAVERGARRARAFISEVARAARKF